MILTGSKKWFMLQVVEKLRKWQIFMLQITLPTVIVIPFYLSFNFNYGLKGTSRPLLLSTEDPRYDQVLSKHQFFNGLVGK